MTEAPVESAPPGLHVAVVTETYPPEINGVANTMRQLVSGLRRLGHRVALVRPRQQGDRPGTATRPADDALRQLVVPGLPLPGYRGLRFGLPVPGRLKRFWADDVPDVVYIATQGPLGHAALRTAERLGIPTLTGFHTQFHQYSRHYGVGVLMRPIMQVLRRFHNRSDLTLVPTASLKDELAMAGFGHVQVFSRGVDTERFSPQRRSTALRTSWGCREATPVLLYVGRLAAEKNLDLALRTFDEARAAVADLRCVLVGDGPELDRLRREHPDMIFTGAKVGEELARHYASADLFVFPSLTETFGNVLLEAMASGVAPVAFDYAAAREHLRDGHNGRAVPFDDDAGFRGAVIETLRMPAQLRAMGIEARKTAETLGWERVIGKLLAHVTQLAERNAAERAPSRSRTFARQLQRP